MFGCDSQYVYTRCKTNSVLCDTFTTHIQEFTMKVTLLLGAKVFTDIKSVA